MATQCDNALRQIVRNRLGRELADEELAQFETQFEGIVRKFDDPEIADVSDAIARATEEFSDEIEVAAMIERRNTLMNKWAEMRLVEHLTDTWGDRPDIGLRAWLVGVQTGRRTAQYSVGAVQESLKSHWLTGMITDLEKAGVHRQVVRGEMDREIWRAMHELSQPEPDQSVLSRLPADAIKAAEVFERYSETARTAANEAGAHIGKLPGRVVRQTHDMYRVKQAGPEGWKRYVRENLDWQRSFPDVRTAEQADELLDSLYTQFASGEHLKFGDGPTTGLKGFGNIGKKMSQERVLHFRDADASFDYNRRFGTGNLVEGMVYGLEHSARNVGLMRQLGPNAETSLDNAIDAVKKRLGKNPDQLERFSREAEKLKRTAWPNLTGESNIPGSAMGAKVSMGVRVVQQMSKLGAAVLSAVSDIPFAGSLMRYQGDSMLGGMGTAIKGLLRGRTTTEQREILGMLGVLHDGMTATAAGRFDVSDNIPGRMAKANQIFFRFNGLQWWTDQVRSSVALALSHRLALKANSTFDGLGPDLKRALELNGLDEGKWDVLRQGVTRELDGRDYLTPEGIRDLSDDVFADYLQRHRGESPNKTRIRRARQEIEDQARGYFHNSATEGAIVPNAKTRATLLRGTRPGTVEGEFLRHAMLFKSFITSVIQKPLAREIHGRSADVDTTFRKLMQNGNGELAGLSNLLIWNTLAGYAAMSVKDLAKGREPRDPNSVETWQAAMVQGGGLGIYGDFLFGDMKNRFGGTALSTLLGPTAGSFNDLVDLSQRMRDGDDTASQAFATALNHAPGANLFYTRFALDYLVLWRIQESMNPGSLARMERRIKKENDQEFLVSPREAAR